jgi:hypothetical protein
MKMKECTISLFLGFIFVTITPFFDTVLITTYKQVEKHRLGYPLPIIEQHTTLTPIDDSFPFELGLVDPRNHPTDILFINYSLSVFIIGTFIYIIYFVIRKWITLKKSR